MSRHGDEHLYPGLDPPLGAISVQETSQTRTRLRQLPALGVSMLTLNHALLASQLAGHEAERFAGVAITASLSGAVYIDECGTRFECSLADEIVASDHFIVTLRVDTWWTASGQQDVGLLIFHHSTSGREAAN